MAKKCERGRQAGKNGNQDRVKFIIGREKSEDEVLAAIKEMAEKAGLEWVPEMKPRTRSLKSLKKKSIP